MWKWVLGGVVAFAAIMFGSKAFASERVERSGDIIPPPPPAPPNSREAMTSILRTVKSGNSCFDAIANGVLADYFGAQRKTKGMTPQQVIDGIQQIYSNTCGKIDKQQRDGIASVKLMLAIPAGIAGLRNSVK